MASLLNKTAVKDFITKKLAADRPSLGITQISSASIAELEVKLRLMIEMSIKRHPTKGKTFKEIQVNVV